METDAKLGEQRTSLSLIISIIQVGPSGSSSGNNQLPGIHALLLTWMKCIILRLYHGFHSRHAHTWLDHPGGGDYPMVPFAFGAGMRSLCRSAASVEAPLETSKERFSESMMETSSCIPAA